MACLGGLALKDMMRYQASPLGQAQSRLMVVTKVHEGDVGDFLSYE